MQRRKSAKVCSHFCVLCRTIFFAPNTVWHKWQPSKLPLRNNSISSKRDQHCQLTSKGHPYFMLAPLRWQFDPISSNHTKGRDIVGLPSPCPLPWSSHRGRDALHEGEGAMLIGDEVLVELPDVNSQVSSQMNPATVQDLTNNAGKVPISKKSWIHMRTIFNNIHVFLPNQYSNI